MQTKKRARRAARQLFRLCLVDGALDDGAGPPGRAAARRRPGDGCAAGPGALPAAGAARSRPAHGARRERRAAGADDAARQRRAAAARTHYGARLNDLVRATNPALIGGMRITVGSDVYDGSVRGRLAALDSALLSSVR